MEIGIRRSRITIASLISSVRGINFSLKVATTNNVADNEAMVGKMLDLRTKREFRKAKFVLKLSRLACFWGDKF
ncbi:MAG: hypothetical protein HY457_01125 [Parcubacteria group bacterium]|nr:hypothetical protein [Parcubacteria group bacterium]